MGATNVVEAYAGQDVKAAFHTLHQNARYDHGSGGYTGSFAEFPGFFITDRTIRSLEDALDFADRNVDRLTRKWGDAAAIPYANMTIESGHYRQVQVQVRLRIDKDDDLWALPHSWSYDGTPTFTAALKEKILDAAKAKVRLRKDETGRFSSRTNIVHESHRSGISFENWSVSSAATPGKAVTRYVIAGSRDHTTWETGFDTQAQARAAAVELLGQGYGMGAPLTISAVTKREDGRDLVVLSSRARWVSATVSVVVRTAKPAPTEPGGWVFFGVASS